MSIEPKTKKSNLLLIKKIMQVSKSFSKKKNKLNRQNPNFVVYNLKIGALLPENVIANQIISSFSHQNFRKSFDF